MKHTFFFFMVWLMLLMTFSTRMEALTPTDGIMMPKGDFCIALMADNGIWDQYWEGTRLIHNANIGKFTRMSVMPMVAYGISNR